MVDESCRLCGTVEWNALAALPFQIIQQIPSNPTQFLHMLQSGMCINWTELPDYPANPPNSIQFVHMLKSGMCMNWTELRDYPANPSK